MVRSASGSGPGPLVAGECAVVQNARREGIIGGVHSSITSYVSPKPHAPRRRLPLSADPRPVRRPFARLAALFAAAVLVVVPAIARSSAPAAPAPATPRSKPAAAPKTVEATAAPSDTATRRAIVIEGDNHLFMISAPEGWVLDDTSGMGSRIRCVFYPKGQKWNTAPTVMYVNPLHGYGAKARTVSSLMAEDEKSFHKNAPKGKVTDGGTIQTTGRKTAVVRYFSYDGGPAHEAVAYVPESELVMLLVLSSKTPEGFQGALAAYRELVQSYAWVASNSELGR